MMRIRETPSAGAGYIMAIAVTVLTFALRYQLRDVLGEFATFLPFIVAIILAAWFGGFWPGLMATVLGGALTMYFFFPLYGATTIESAIRGVTVLVFLAIGILTSILSEELHAARRLLESEQAKGREHEAFNEIIAELTSDFVYRGGLDAEGRVVVEAISDGFTKLLGYSLSELNALGAGRGILHPEDREKADSVLQGLVVGETVEGESRFVTKDSRVVWLRYRMRPIQDEGGRLVRVYGAASDVTRHREADAAMQASEERFRLMAATVPSMIWTAAPDGTITYANEQWLRYCGIPAGEQPLTWPELAPHPDDYHRCMSRWTRALRDGIEYEIEVRHRRHDGAYRWFVTRAMPMKDEGGHVVSWVGVTTDIHEQKEMQEQLQLADRRKDEFLATLAHELRNPLAPVRNAIEIMERADNEPLREEALHIVKRQVQHMVRLIDDLLDVSRITSGRLTLRTERVELSAVLRAAMETSRPWIESSGHTLDLSIPPQPIYLSGDPARLAQVFANLLNNSAKFTPRGGRISLIAERSGNTVMVTVRDTGIGIPKDMIPQVFDMFTQVDASSHRTPGGLGIGLTIVKLLVEMHGGQVEARSEGPTYGAEFLVRLPVEETASAERRPRVGSRSTPTSGMTRRRVLVVDDNEDAVVSLAMLLRLTSHDVRTAGDGIEALQVAASERPDAVLLDIGLPRLNGYDVARRIREQEWGKRTLLIAMTGWGQDQDKQRAMEAGFDFHLTKPVDPEVLERLLADPSAQLEAI
jgi:PAS domain S-box-containing protein